MSNWYIVKMVFKVSATVSGNTLQFQEQWRLIAADSAMAVLTKAQQLALAETASKGQHHMPLCWTFFAVTEIIPLQTMADGTEICNQLQEPSNEKQYCSYLQQQSHRLMTNQHSLSL